MDHEHKIAELVERQYRQVRSEMVRRATRVQSEVLRATGDFLRQRGFVQIMPVVVSPVTDPLRHATGKAEVEYYQKHAPYLVDNPPVSTFMQLSRLNHPDALFEIDVTTVV